MWITPESVSFVLGFALSGAGADVHDFVSVKKRVASRQVVVFTSVKIFFG
jgi:hypothetical protein